MGWGFIEGDRQGFSRCSWGVIKAPGKLSLANRLGFIYDALSVVHEEIKPEVDGEKE